MARRQDKELEEFRSLMEVPSTFLEGFNWSSLFGAIFIAVLMVPGAIYMGLLAGVQQMVPAAQWVTVILFIEVAKRAHKHLNRAEIFVLFFMAGAAMGMPFHGLLWNQFFARSDAATAYGIAKNLPTWFAPAADSASYAARSFFHADWLPVIGLVVFGTFVSQLSNMVLGYGLFRVASDLEKLPFPMAPIGAQGIMALAEDIDEKQSVDDEDRWRWRVFSIGGALGLAFGALYLGLPTLTGALTDTPIQILPIPFSDFTSTTQRYLPAVATGIAWDMGHLLIGMVLPFFAMLGSFIGLLVTVVLNPILYRHEILTSWTPGDNTIATLFKNNVDFY
ncbi:peptide transporter, partial [bacterium]|nr:peptide transporter [bacterium]